jgi:hypothetical protein
MENNNTKKKWAKQEIDDLELSFLHSMYNCNTVLGVNATYSYAKFMSNVKLDPDNYPVFLILLMLPNHYVTDALLGDNDPETFFSPVQPNAHIIKECFRILTKYPPGGIYEKVMIVIFGILKILYEEPQEGFRQYSLTPEEVNSIGKHLDKSLAQDNPANRLILHILDRIASLVDVGIPVDDTAKAQVANQANNIRGKFLDMTKHLYEAIPEKLLIKGDYAKDEIAPSF